MSRSKKIHINCDMGESFGRYTLVDDASLMPHIDACNIACGFHAGDSSVMDRTIYLAMKAGVEIGAHPSYPDRQGFGRRPMELQGDELESLIRYQICALRGMVHTHGGKVTHVKAHGALYNKAANNELEAHAVIRAVCAVSRDLILYAPHNSLLSEMAIDQGLSVLHEAFIDRRYNSDGSLVSRKIKGAVIINPLVAWAQVKKIKEHQLVRSVNDQEFTLDADTFCIHGDNPSALSILEYLKGAQ